MSDKESVTIIAAPQGLKAFFAWTDDDDGTKTVILAPVAYGEVTRFSDDGNDRTVVSWFSTDSLEALATLLEDGTVYGGGSWCPNQEFFLKERGVRLADSRA
jgi:hypothetical protein